MEIHKPKPSHNLLEFLSEVAVVLLGIVIALAGEQTLLSLESRHKIRLVAAEMRQEISGDDGPQVLERIALSKCVDSALDAIRGSAETNADRSAILDSIARFSTPRHTWDSAAFQAALSAGILAQMPTDRVDAMSRFYSLMPALESANEREFRDGASLAAISRAGGPLTESERGQVLSAVETLRCSRTFARLIAAARRTLLWRATEPIFQALKDANPKIVTVSREYREPVYFDTEVNVAKERRR